MNRLSRKAIIIIAVVSALTVTAAIGVGVILTNTPREPTLKTAIAPYTVYEGDPIESMRSHITVTYVDGKGAEHPVTDYTLSTETDLKTFAKGENVITVAYTDEHDNKLTNIITVNAQIKPIRTYTITFKADGRIINTQTFTTENDYVNEPDVPDKLGYSGKWETYSLSTSDITVNAIYTPITYTVTFKAGDTVVDTQTYTVENNDIAPPDAPTKTGYAVAWEHYELTVGDVIVNAVYTPEKYNVTLNYDGATSGNTQQTVTVTYDLPIGKLPMPEKTGYNFIGWYYGSKLVTSDTVWNYDADNAEFTARWSTDEFTVTFLADGKIIDIQTYSVENKNITEPEVPNKTGYTGVWQNYVITMGNIAVNAIYTPIIYTATFMADGLTVSTQTYTVENKTISMPAVPDKTGYTGAWEYYELTFGDVTVNALYTAKQYTVSLDYDGATIGNEQKTVTVTYDRPIGNLPMPEKTGYNFIGWYYESTLVTSDTVWNYDADNAELTAKWLTDEFTVTFIADGQTIDVQTFTVENKNITEPAVPNKTGYNGVWENYELTTNNLTVNAIYSLITYTVTFVADNQTVGTQTYTIENANITEPNVPSKTGYTGVWESYELTIGDNTINAIYTPIIYTVTFKADDAVIDTQNYTVENKNITEPAVPSKTGYTGSWKYYELTFGNVTVNALYTAKQYTVSLDYDGATGGNTQQTVIVTYNKQIGNLPAPTKNGFEFAGWNYNQTSVTTSTVWNFDAETVIFTAQWTVIYYTVTFESNGGSPVENLTNVTYNSTINPPEEPSKTNCEFLGWYTDSALNNRWDFATDKITENTTLYAKWVDYLSYLTFTLSNDRNYYSVKGSNSAKNAVSIVIPSEYNGKPVNAIDTQAFKDCNKLVSIVIPESITNIKYYAFNNCTNLTNVKYTGTIADWCKIDGLDNIMFTSRTLSLNGNELSEELVIPKDVTTIKTSAFMNCTEIISVKFEESSTCVNISDNVFKGCNNLTSIIIPDTLTSIGANAFINCSKLQYNPYENGLYLGNDGNKYLALIKTNDRSITSLQINETTKIIAGAVFKQYFELTNIIMPKSVKNIGAFAFSQCNNLTKVNYGGTIKDWCDINLSGSDANPLSNGADLYIDGQRVVNLTIPNTVTEIKRYAFEGCTSITSAVIPNSITNIGESAFYNCSNLTSMTLPFAVTDFRRVICDNSRLKTVVITGGTTIPWKAFEYCTSITNVTIPSSVTSIGNEAFKGCIGLSNLTIPNSVTSIGTSAFEGCSNLTSVILSTKVTSIGKGAFAECTGLKNITLPFVGASKTGTENTHFGYIFGASSYSENAAKVPASLTTVNIESTYSRTSYHFIGERAFQGCNNITNVTLNNVFGVGAYAFYSCTGLTDVTILPTTSANTIFAINSNAFAFCENLTSITLPSQTESIEHYAFYSCTKLATVKYEGTVEDWNNVRKNGSPFLNIPAKTITCADGTVKI